MKAIQGEVEIGVSVVTIAELVHGAYRTKTEAQRQRRLEFIERLASDVPVHPVTLDIARLAGRIEGQQEAVGVQFAFEDLLIGATALHLGYEVATLNLRDFQRIPSLSVDCTDGTGGNFVHQPSSKRCWSHLCPAEVTFLKPEGVPGFGQATGVRGQPYPFCGAN